MQQSLFYTPVTVFYWKNKYSKVLNGDAHGTTTRPSCGTSQGPNDRTFWERPEDVGRRGFLNSTQKPIKLTLTGYSNTLQLVEVAKNSVKSIEIKKQFKLERGMMSSGKYY